MKQILLICAVVVLVGCHAGNKGAEEAKLAAKAKAIAEARAAAESKRQSTIVEIADPIVEKAIRKSLKKLTGELTKTDLVKVTILNMDNSQITDEGLKELAKLQQLEELYMYRTQITDAGLKELARLQKLESLSVIGTKVTKAGVAELKKALPNCLISGGL